MSIPYHYSPTLVCTSDCSFCISDKRYVYSFGYSKYGKHGHSKKNKNNILFIPKKISSLSNINIICCGLYHTICLDYLGKVFGFGINKSGQLGLGNKNKQIFYTPKKICLPSIQSISCGNNFTICLSKGGKLYSFGNNNNGQLGLGFSGNCVYIPQEITDLNNIDLIECGAKRGVAKTISGDYYSWGSGNKGELGLYKTVYSIPVLCKDWPTDIISIKCGFYHSLFLTTNGFVYGCGSNKFGQLGYTRDILTSSKIPILIEGLALIKRIEIGVNCSYCIDIDNNLWVFGYNEEGNLGLGDKLNKYKPIQHNIQNIIDISKGGDGMFIKTINNTIYSFGNNNKGQLSLETEDSLQLEPIEVFKNIEYQWTTNILKRNKQKSARK